MIFTYISLSGKLRCIKGKYLIGLRLRASERSISSGELQAAAGGGAVRAVPAGLGGGRRRGAAPAHHRGPRAARQRHQRRQARLRGTVLGR